VPIRVAPLWTPTGPDESQRTIAVTLPDSEVTAVEVFVDGERFTAAGADLDEP
jgi:hypothetical protein